MDSIKKVKDLLELAVVFSQENSATEEIDMTPFENAFETYENLYLKYPDEIRCIFDKIYTHSEIDASDLLQFCENSHVLFGNNQQDMDEFRKASSSLKEFMDNPAT